MNDYDWQQLIALRAALAQNLMSYDARAQEKYTQLLVESLRGKGDSPLKDEQHGMG